MALRFSHLQFVVLRRSLGLQSSRRFCSGHSRNDGRQSEAEKAKKAQRVWEMMVPEANWDFRSPMIPALLLGIVLLQYLITKKQGDAAERELEEVRQLKEERKARREEREAALAASGKVE
eukprot:TRINITY_DN7886_c0_g1_i1.p2 TRINITY_DN7886_c0_g1~~TRINITY_DN7886_c0_g1_i1.p2  ORF type:complete len:127 (-),score=30.97 TRINITY_DN7886_c0_g1_i1:291-650(-)